MFWTHLNHKVDSLIIRCLWMIWKRMRHVLEGMFCTITDVTTNRLSVCFFFSCASCLWLNLFSSPGKTFLFNVFAGFLIVFGWSLVVVTFLNGFLPGYLITRKKSWFMLGEKSRLCLVNVLLLLLRFSNSKQVRVRVMGPLKVTVFGQLVGLYNNDPFLEASGLCIQVKQYSCSCGYTVKPPVVAKKLSLVYDCMYVCGCPGES